MKKLLVFALAFVATCVWISIGMMPVGNAATGCPVPGFLVGTVTGVGTGPDSIAVGDFNGDGNIDLVVANYSGNNLSFLSGNSFHRFQVTGTIGPVSLPKSVVAGDFNKDGKLDLAVSKDGTTSVAIFPGNGNGLFATPTDVGVGRNPHALVTLDLNNDGNLDLVTGNDSDSTLSVLLGNGAGGFSAANTVQNIRAASIASADFNGDGKKDLAITNFSNGKVTVLAGDGTGGFSTPVNFSAGSNLQGIATGDFNQDGRPDIVATNYSDCCNPAFVAVLLNDGTGSFGAPALISVPAGPISVAAGDVNGDGNVDIATANNNQVSASVSVLLGNGNGTFATPMSVPLGGSPNFVISADLTGDSIDDLAVTNWLNGSVHVLLNPCSFPLPPSPTPTPSPTPVASPTPVPGIGDIVISQVYAGGGSPGAKYTNAYLELYNRGTSDVNISGWQFSVTRDSPGSPISLGTSFSFISTRGIFVRAGGYLLLQLGSEGTDGAPLPVTPDLATSDQSPVKLLLDTSGTISLRAPLTGFPAFQSCPASDSKVSDFVAYGRAGSCIEGSGPAPGLNNTIALLRKGEGCTDTNDNAADFTTDVPAPHNSNSAVHSCAADTPKLRFDSASYSVSEGQHSIEISVDRLGDASGTVSVDYATSDATAHQRTDYTTSTGTLVFQPGETRKAFTVLVTDNSYVDANRTVNLSLSKLTGGAVISTPAAASLTIDDDDAASGTTNPADDPQFFVRQHYFDFLNRLPDDDGFAYWTGQFAQCGTDVNCFNQRRIGISDAFFFEPEFQESGAYVYRVYKAAFGAVPSYAQFMPDRSRVVGGAGLDASKTGFARVFVGRPAFVSLYPRNQSATEFLTALLNRIKNNSGVDLSSQQDALAALYDGTDNGRAAILRQVADNPAFIDAEYRRSFVLMEYFGYLRRDPDTEGFNFWLGQVNRFPLRDVGIQHAMACSFITSREYQERFSLVVTHTNAECPQ
jgi:hypothetical protein